MVRLFMSISRPLLLAVGLSASFSAQAGWFDWFKPGEWLTAAGSVLDTEGAEARGFYVGGGLGVVRADWGMERRLGGPNDPDPLYQSEPAYLTTANLRGGWAPFSWLEIEGEWNFDLDKAEISENPRQVAELDSLSGIYLRPQLPLGGALLFLELGYNQINVNAQCNLNETFLDGTPYRDERLAENCKNFKDSGVAWGAGISFKMSEQAHVLVSYRQLYDDDFDDNGSDDSATALMIGVTASFGGGGSDDDYY